MIDVTYKVNGFDVRYIVGDKHFGGLLIDPTNHQFDNPDYAEALQLAAKVYPIINAAEILKEWSLTPPGDMQQARETYIDSILEFAALVKDNPYGIQMHDQAWEYVTLARAEKRIRQEEEERRKYKQQKRVANTGGYVYLVQSPTENYKIGRTKNPENRMRTFGVQLPFEVEYVCVIKTPDMYALERELHERFASKRVNGEWFTLETADVEYIKGLAS